MGSREILTRAEWAVAAKRRLGTDHLDVLSFELRPLGSEGAGFLGEHRLAEVKVQLKDARRSQHTLKFFVKFEPETLADQREISEQSGSFRKEVGALSDLFVEFRSALENDGKGMEWTCQCFYTRPDVLVLEDLMDVGYQLINSRIQTGVEHCAVVLRALANFHAAALIFEETRPVQPYCLGRERSDVLSGGFIENTPGHPGLRWLEANVKCVWTLVEEMRGAEYLRRTKTQLEEEMYTIIGLHDSSDRFRNVVCHGDVWRNNIFFRMEKDEPVQALLVDFQLVRYAPPAADVMTFFHLTTSRAFRTEHCPGLLALYYEYLSQTLKNYGLHAERILPWEEFKESCNFYRKLGVVLAPGESSIMFIKETDISHVFASSSEFIRFLMGDRSPEAMHAFKTDQIYRERLTEVIDELIEVCIEKKYVNII